MEKLVIASSNPGKIKEIKRIILPYFPEIIPQAELNISETEEPYHTFVENALVKARHASRESGLPALSDDSGICVDALQGAPGVHSARFAGEPKSDARNNQKLVTRLRDESNRRAHYYCVIVMVRHPEDPEPLIAEGIWHGEIIDEPRGSGGFGYDPFFLIPKYGKTGAEISLDLKNKISHRALALQSLVEKLKSRTG